MDDQAGTDIKLDRGPVATVAVDALLVGDSPRLVQESEDHIRVLAELGDVLPPIIVHRDTMRVIDGRHRLRAAKLRGFEKIDVQYFDGNPEDAFVLAVKANVAHGLPLSLAERKEAAGRILSSHPNWSDRAVASVVGLAATTIAVIRESSSVHVTQLDVRVGRDGRARPLDGAAGRRRASEVLAKNPNVALRELSATADISMNTARDVRDRLRRGEDPVPPKQRNVGNLNEGSDDSKWSSKSSQRVDSSKKPAIDRTVVLQTLRSDPSLRFAEQGRILLRLLDSYAVVTTNWSQIAETVPGHWARDVASLADECAQAWRHLADQLRDRKDESA